MFHVRLFLSVLCALISCAWSFTVTSSSGYAASITPIIQGSSLPATSFSGCCGDYPLCNCPKLSTAGLALDAKVELFTMGAVLTFSPTTLLTTVVGVPQGQVLAGARGYRPTSFSGCCGDYPMCNCPKL